MARVYNFSAGPAVLPEEVLQEAADEMLDYRGTGMSVMEMSHRSKAYDTIIKEAEADLRELMNIPDNYKVQVCPFDAIHVKNGVAVVDKEKCKACGKCVEVCPKHLISLIPYSNTVQVACSSTDKGPVTMKACTTGCVGCGICVKNCQHDAVKVENFHAVIDPEKCVGCGACMEKCPKKCIVKA